MLYFSSTRLSVSRYQSGRLFCLIAYFGCQINACASAAIEIEVEPGTTILGIDFIT